MFSLIHKLIGTCNYRGPECKSSESTYNIYTYNPHFLTHKTKKFWVLMGSGGGMPTVSKFNVTVFLLCQNSSE
jgi:hypothetical protein